MMNFIRCRKGFIGLEVAIATAAVFIFAVGAMNHPVSDSADDQKNCMQNLEQIYAAKEQWAMDNNKKQEDIPTWEELKGPKLYIKSEDSTPLVCPNGGTYTINNMATDPICSLGNTVSPAHISP